MLQLKDVLEEGELYVQECKKLLEAVKRLERSSKQVKDKFTSLLNNSVPNKEMV